MALDDNTWKWAPILLLSPLPWALISLFIMIGGQMVLNVALTECEDPSGNTVDTSGMTLGTFLGITAAYIFLITFVWTWLGHSVFLLLPVRQDKKWSLKRVRVLKPFSKLKTIAIIYGITCALSFGAAISLTVGVGNAATLCSDQTPLILSFSTFSMIIYWIAIGITGSRLFTVVKGDEIRAKLKGTALGNGEKAPENDVDAVRIIFKQFDSEGVGHMESSDLGAFLEVLGVQTSPDELSEILVSCVFRFGLCCLQPYFQKSCCCRLTVKNT
mmetsp:Transcript_55548/g.104225  ORF Transcript_55548/g.104225 Transcript_55548/m.104225 type:complete len:272 (+) Transcript_55548:148-963(+)